MVDYKQTKIYYIQVGDQRYYGHTTQRLLSQRTSQHRWTYNQGKNIYKLYAKIKEMNMRIDEINCIWVEDYPCDSKNEALAREQFWINKEKPELNQKRAIAIDRHEYYQQNKDNFRLKHKEYKDKLREDPTAWERYREQQRESARRLYPIKKEERNKKQLEKVECKICGFMGARNHLARHMKRHQQEAK